MKEIKYTFSYINKCNMCGADSNFFKIIGQRQNRAHGRKPYKNIAITTTIIKCKNCGLIFSNPLPIPNNINDHYGVLPEEYWKEEYFHIDKNFNISTKNLLSRYMDIKGDMKSLDIGAGMGKHMIAYEYAGFDSYGLEPSEPFFEKAIKNMGINKDKIKLCSIEDANYAENYFDFISFSAVLEHLYAPSLALSKAINWLKPNGLIYIECPSSKWLVGKIANLYYKTIGTNYVSNLSPMHNPYHLYEFSIKSFKLNGKINNYDIYHHEFWVGKTYMPKFTDKFLKYCMKHTNTGMDICIFLKKNTN